MDENSKSWPMVMGITAGILGGLIAGIYLYSARSQHDPQSKLRDAQDIISQCRQKIKQIEADLEMLRQPLVA